MKRKVVVFVQPPVKMTGRYARVAKGIAVPPLGLCWLAAVVREHGYEAAIVDAPALGLDTDATVAEILALNPSYVGIGATSVLIHSAGRVAKQLKSLAPDVPLIVGGIHVTVSPHETMAAFPELDVGVLGEGEETILELLDALEKGVQLDGIRGLIFRDGMELRVTESRPFLRDLDSLPLPAWDCLPNLATNYQQSFSRIEKLPAASVITSRGCYGKCIFCVRVFGNSCRAHSADYLLRMIKHLRTRYGIRSLAIEDDNFVAFRGRLRDLRKRWVTECDGVSWSCAARADVVTPEALLTMKEMGCWSVSYGIESGSQRILDFENKGITLKRIEDAVRWAKAAGIMVKGYFIVGHPLETVETIQESIDFAKRIELDDFQMSFMVPFPGTELHRRVREYGRFDDDWEKMDLWTEPTFIPHGLSADILRASSRRAMREFYFRPRIVANYVKRALRNPEAALGYVREGVRVARFLLTRGA